MRKKLLIVVPVVIVLLLIGGVAGYFLKGDNGGNGGNGGVAVAPSGTSNGTPTENPTATPSATFNYLAKPTIIANTTTTPGQIWPTDILNQYPYEPIMPAELKDMVAVRYNYTVQDKPGEEGKRIIVTLIRKNLSDRDMRGIYVWFTAKDMQGNINYKLGTEWSTETYNYKDAMYKPIKPGQIEQLPPRIFASTTAQFTLEVTVDSVTFF